MAYATHLVGLSELDESISIDDGVGARDKWRKDDSSSKDPVILLMRLVSECLSLDLMMVRSNTCKTPNKPTYLLIVSGKVAVSVPVFARDIVFRFQQRNPKERLTISTSPTVGMNNSQKECTGRETSREWKQDKIYNVRVICRNHSSSKSVLTCILISKDRFQNNS